MGIYDRDYFRAEPEPHFRFAFPKLGSAVKSLIIINFAVFLIQAIDLRIERSAGVFTRLFSLTPSLVLHRGFFWQFFTYMFLHASLWHLFLNMLALYFFGTDMEVALGKKRFLKFYLLCGLAGGAAQFIFSAFINPQVLILGASGAVLGVLVAFAILYPNRMLLLFFIIPVRARTVIYLLIFINIIYGLDFKASGVAAFAHLGGMLAGYLYIKHYFKSRRTANIINVNFAGKPALFHRLKTLFRKRRRPTTTSRAEIDDTIDRIIDKVHNEGLDSLTKEEKKFLDDLKKKHSV